MENPKSYEDKWLYTLLSLTFLLTQWRGDGSKYVAAVHKYIGYANLSRHECAAAILQLRLSKHEKRKFKFWRSCPTSLSDPLNTCRCGSTGAYHGPT
jgi:hypothetical protein